MSLYLLPIKHQLFTTHSQKFSSQPLSLILSPIFPPAPGEKVSYKMETASKKGKRKKKPCRFYKCHNMTLIKGEKNCIVISIITKFIVFKYGLSFNTFNNHIELVIFFPSLQMKKPILRVCHLLKVKQLGEKANLEFNYWLQRYPLCI